MESFALVKVKVFLETVHLSVFKTTDLSVRADFFLSTKYFT